MRYFFSICILHLFLQSCNRDTIPYPDRGYGYFPLKTGNWIMYEVDSVVYKFNDTDYTSQYYLKEYVESEFYDNANHLSYRIERYTTTDTSAPWVIKDVWVANRTASTAERVEENQRYIKLMFPVKPGLAWNGNAYNNLGEMEYEFTETDVPATINSHTFDSSLTVLQQDDKNLIQTRYSSEMYAKNTGMIRKEFKNLDKNIDGTINKGVEYTMKVVSYKIQ